AVQHGVGVRAEDDVDVLLRDEPAQPIERPALDTALHVAAHQLLQSSGQQLRKQLLLALQVSQVKPEAARIQMVQQRDDVLLRSADFQRVDDEENVRLARAAGAV